MSTTLAQLRRASTRNHNPRMIGLPAVAAVPACHLCRLPMTAPGACPGRDPAGQKAGLGHESVQYPVNRAMRRQRWLYAKDGRRVGRVRPRGAVLGSRSRVARLRLAHLADWARITGASDAAKVRILAQRDAAAQRKARRDARPGRIRAGLYQTAWLTARRVKLLETQERRDAALAKADGVIARMRRRRGAA